MTSLGDMEVQAANLHKLAASVTPQTVVSVLQQGIATLGEDLPGDPDGLDDLSVSFRKASEGVRTVGEDTTTTGNGRMARWWNGSASDAAVARTTSSGRAVAGDHTAFERVSGVASSLAEGLRQAKNAHGTVRQGLFDLLARAGDIPAGAPPGDPMRARLAQAVAGHLNAGAGVLQQAHAMQTDARNNLQAAFAPARHDPGGGGAENPARDGRLSPEEILEQYQVADDEMTTWPGAPWSWFVDEIEVTEKEAELLDDIGLAGAKDMQDIRDQAFGEADDRFATEDQNDDHNDAFRHAYWNALMTSRFGEDFADAYGTAHEGVPGNPADREAMDLYNNEVGRRIAAENPDASPEELADLVEQAVRDGEMVVIDGDGDLAYSDQVPEGQTGEADDAPHEGGDEPPDAGSDESSDGYDPGGADDESGTASGN